MAPNRRLLVFAASLVALVGGAEALVRWQEDAFAAASHRARFKAALLRRQTGLTFALVGTSRFNDGLDPAWLEHGRGFNASVPSSSLAAQALLADAALARPGLKTLVLEASPRQLERAGDPSLVTGEEREPEDFEARALGRSLLLRHRRVLMVDNLPRLVALWLPLSFDGSEFFHTRWLLETWRAKPATLPDFPAPELRCPGPPGEVTAEHEAAAVAWTALAQRARRQDADVFFVVPPVAQGRRAELCTPEWEALWQAVATRTGAPVYDFGCAVVPDALFHDGYEHLGVEGRAALSHVVGALWTQARRTPPCAGGAP